MTRTPSSPAPETAPANELILRLYVSGATPASSRAVVNTRRFCETYLHGRYRLEIVDIAENVALATGDQVVAAPTLIRIAPLPSRRLIGDMSNTQRMLDGLNVKGPRT